MTLSDERSTNLRIAGIVNLKDDHKYRVLKIFSPSGPIVFKRIDGSTHRGFLRTPGHVDIRAPQMVNRSTQSNPPPSASDDPLAQALLQCCGPDTVAAYHQGRPVPIVWEMFIGSRYPKPSNAPHSSLWDTNFKQESIMTIRNCQRK